MLRPWADIVGDAEVILTMGLEIGPGRVTQRVLRIQADENGFAAVLGDVVRAEVLGSHPKLAVLLHALNVYLGARIPSDDGRGSPNQGFDGWSRRQYDLPRLMAWSEQQVTLAECGLTTKPLGVFGFNLVGAPMSIMLQGLFDLRHGSRNDTVSICTTPDLEAVLHAIGQVLSATTTTQRIDTASSLARTVGAYESRRSMGGAAPV